MLYLKEGKSSISFLNVGPPGAPLANSNPLMRPEETKEACAVPRGTECCYWTATAQRRKRTGFAD